MLKSNLHLTFHVSIFFNFKKIIIKACYCLCITFIVIHITPYNSTSYHTVCIQIMYMNQWKLPAITFRVLTLITLYFDKPCVYRNGTYSNITFMLGSLKESKCIDSRSHMHASGWWAMLSICKDGEGSVNWMQASM